MAKQGVSNQRLLQEALTKAGFSSLHCEEDLGFVGWCPPPRNTTTRGAPYRYKSLKKATGKEIRQYAVSNKTPDVIALDDVLPRLPIHFEKNIPKQIVAQKFPYGKIGVASLYHAHKSKKCDLSTFDFYFGCSALEILSAERKTGKKRTAPFLVQQVPGTNMIMIHYSLDFGQDYSVPGFQFERLLIGGRLNDRHDAGFTEHVQTMRIGEYRVLMTAEVDAVDASGNPAEIKLIKQGGGGTKVFFQMVGSGSTTLYKGKNDNGILKSVNAWQLGTMAESIARNHDVPSLERKLIRNMERVKEFQRQGYFDNGKVYRIDFDPNLTLHLLPPSRDALLPPAAVVKDLLGIVDDDEANSG